MRSTRIEFHSTANSDAWRKIPTASIYARWGGDAARVLPGDGRTASGCVVLLTVHALVKVDGAEACVDSSRTGVVKRSVDDVSAAVDVDSRSMQRIEC